MSELQQVCQHAQSSQYDEPSWSSNTYQPPANLDGITQQAIHTYMYSKQSDGTMGGLGWGWQSANGYTALALHELWSGGRNNYQDVADAVKTTERNHSGLTNEFNDDTLWWAMCCIHLYSAAGDPWFLNKAKDIWGYMHAKHAVCGRGRVFFRGRDMEGACYWTTRDGEEAINTVTTGLYAELCARLALVERGTQTKHEHLSWLLHQKKAGYGDYIEAARCSLGWILRCRYRVEDGIILDSIMLKKDEEIDWTFTYTTGIAIGVCALLYELLGQPEYLELALHLANKAMRNTSWVEQNGTLTEPGAYGQGKHDPWEDSDGIGFKSVLIRQLGTLYEVLVRTRPDHQKAMATAHLIKTFINVNFQSQQERNTNGNGQYGPWWNGPFEAPTSHSQMAAMDVMAAVRLVNAGR
ncbi:hypothetical protein AMS68_000774 [Peltaster fructicola]|uniref:Uncharacterized protein n=1 Tax=Peltaster fructicola TaxID=286661 RepID=A0A6H0XKI8_9PEZI|nr:hypothetical protein AMS68_000774 [Peltaster fructicola]